MHILKVKNKERIYGIYIISTGKKTPNLHEVASILTE